jgi:hypothetical protein
MYAAARTLPLAIVVFVAIFKRSLRYLFILGILAGTIQFADAFVGIHQNDIGKIAGPLFLSALQFYAVFKLHRYFKTQNRNLKP